ncbi:MAG: LIC12048 family lipoprotein [Leptospirales bacterium]
MNTLRIFKQILKAPLRYLLFTSIALSAFGIHCKGSVEVEAISLIADPVDPVDPPVITEPPLIPLFNLQPGQSAKLAGFGGVDPVGTLLGNDFDGDGFSNEKEMISNFWVADYPMIETEISAPITMTIEILKDVTGQSSSIVNEISSKDIESRRNEGSEDFHQNEMKQTTIKVGTQAAATKAQSSDTETTTNSDTSSETESGGGSLSVGLPSAGIGVSANFEVAKTDSNTSTSGGTSQTSNESSSSMTSDLYKVQPFKNNINRSANNVKNDSAQVNARQYRKTKQSKTDTTSKIEPNAGKIRAALFIKNLTLNMPVKLSNILCSLMFETPEGVKIPMQSFLLRNSDYTVFEVEVYGSSEFGPYVVELSGLNTVEVEKAIEQGYTPRIYLIDYDMTHVRNSNYQSALSSSFTGDNLKIIEENSKGRTSLIKFFGPAIREMVRVAAFDVSTQNPNNACELPVIDTNTTVSPGTSMETALNRIACSGMSIEYGHYIYDFSGTDYENIFPKAYSYTIKAINGVLNTFPCHSIVSGTDFNGNPADACLVKVSDLTPEELSRMGVWIVYSNGRHYRMGKYAKDASGNTRTFDGNIPMMTGIHSEVWAGDNYDIFYLSMLDIEGKNRMFGTNPLETYGPVVLNTRWNKDSMGVRPNLPSANSVYLGQAVLGEMIEFEITLDQTWLLNPVFSGLKTKPTYKEYSKFSYNWQNDPFNYYNIDDAFDIEISFSLGESKDNWYNIGRTTGSMISDTNNTSDQISNCGKSWDYLQRTFTVCVRLPAALAGVGPEGVVNVYMRTAPNNAYRENLWPKNFTDVNRYQAKLFQPASMGDTVIETIAGTGEISMGTIEASNTIKVGNQEYGIASVASIGRVYEVNIQSQTKVAYNANAPVVIGGFNGKIKNNTVSSATTLLVRPNTGGDKLTTGSALAGIEVSIEGHIYKVGTVNLFSGIHSITLETPLTTSYHREEAVRINGGLTKSPVILTEDSTFINDWNTGQVSSFTIPETAPFLLAANSSGCLYGVDLWNLLAPACQGDFVNRIVSNWMGAGAFTNDWNDSSRYNKYLSSSLNPLVSASGAQTSMNIEMATSNRRVSLPTVGEQRSVISDSANGRTLVVWQYFTSGMNFDIRGRVYDTNTGAPLSGEFTVNEIRNSRQENPAVTVSGDYAFVAWESKATGDYDIQGRILDLTQNPPTVVAHPEFTVNAASTLDQRSPSVDSEGDVAAVVFKTHNGTNFDIKARLISFSGATTGIRYNSNFTIHSQAIRDFTAPAVAIKNGKALFMYSWHNGTDYDFYIREVDTDPLVAANTTRFCLGGANDQLYPEIVFNDSGTKAFAFYRTGAAPNFSLAGVIVDLVGYTCKTPFNIAASGTSVQSNKSVVSIGNKVVMVYNTNQDGDYDIRARTLSFTTEAMSVATSVNSVITGDQVMPAVVANGNFAFVAWKSIGTGETRAQLIDLKTNKTVDKSDFLIGSSPGPTLQYPSITYNGYSGQIFWQHTDGSTQYKVMGQRFEMNTNMTLPLNYGINNFFVSPLIERTYVIRSRLKY